MIGTYKAAGVIFRSVSEMIFHFGVGAFSHNFTIIIIFNQKGIRLWYSSLIDCWVRMVLLLVSTFRSDFVLTLIDFHCCHCRLTSFYFITSFCVSYNLTMGIPNMMLYSINSDVADVRLPYPAYLILLIIVLFAILSRFFSLFVYFISPFLHVISSVLLILLPSLSIQIGVGFPAAFVVNFLLACYN